MKTSEAMKLIGGLSEPMKMPCFSYSIPAIYCKTGMKLRKVKDTICSKCYAMKFRYLFGNVKNAMQRRFDSLKKSNWTKAMTIAIGAKEKSGVFRWHDSGDIQSLGHLEAIAAIAKALPSIVFWLPTREYSIAVAYFNKHKAWPPNLVVRLSALTINGNPPTAIAKRIGCVTSGVSKQGTFDCPSSEQGGKCLDCRACWNKQIENINYKLH